MNKLLYAIVLIAAFSTALSKETKSVTNNYVPQNRLPEKVINPATFGNIQASINYVNTQDLVNRGRQILQYARPNTVNNAGYQPHYDPNIHTEVYVRIPRTGNQIYGKRW